MLSSHALRSCERFFAPNNYSYTPGQVAVFVDNNQAFLYISDGAKSVTEGDMLIQLTGISTLSKGFTVDSLTTSIDMFRH